MAATVLEQYSWNITVTKGGSPVNGAKVVGFNVSDTLAINETTNASGVIAGSNPDGNVDVEAASHSVALAVTTTTTRNPYDIRVLSYLDNDVLFGKDFTERSTDSAFPTTDTVITETTRATVQAYPGITFTHGSTLITLASGTWNPDRLYDRAKDERVANPQGATQKFIDSVDGINFTQNYDVLIDGSVAFNASGATYSGDWETQNGGTITNITVGNLLVDGPSPQTSFTAVNVPGTMTFDVAGTYTLDACTINEVVNTSGGAVTLSLVNGSTVATNTGPSITIQQSVTITVTAIDADTGSPVEGAAVYIETTLNDVALNEETNTSGVATGTFSETTPATIDDTVSGVKSGSDAKPYVYFTLAGTIEPGTGYSATALLTED